MSKRPPNRVTKTAAAALASQPVQPPDAPAKKAKETAARITKQARVLAMLRSAAGATIPTIMKATDWQRHSVRGFLAGVVKKKLKQKIKSKKVGEHRVYRIAEIAGTRSKTARSRLRAA